VGGTRKHMEKANEKRLHAVAALASCRRAGESELLDILQREAIVGVPGFDWKRWKDILYEIGWSRASHPGEETRQHGNSFT